LLTLHFLYPLLLLSPFLDSFPTRRSSDLVDGLRAADFLITVEEDDFYAVLEGGVSVRVRCRISQLSVDSRAQAQRQLAICRGSSVDLAGEVDGGFQRGARLRVDRHRRGCLRSSRAPLDAQVAGHNLVLDGLAVRQLGVGVAQLRSAIANVHGAALTVAQVEYDHALGDGLAIRALDEGLQGDLP